MSNVREIKLWLSRFRPHWPLGLLPAIGLVLLFAGLNSDYLWADEGDTAVLASNILKFGVPKAWDGVAFIDSDYGARENQHLVMVTTPWPQYYVTAASFLIFGQNTFAARLPFALAGWLTILLVFRLIRDLTKDRNAAFAAAALTLFSVQFLLYARQARYYALSMFFTCWLIWIFFRMKSARECILFAVIAILLFYSHPLGIVPLAALAILTLTYSSFSHQRRWFWLASPPILIFALPWFVIARTGYRSMTTLPQAPGEYVARVVQYVLEIASVTPLIGITVLLLFLFTAWRHKLRQAARDPHSAENSTQQIEGIEPRASAFLLQSTEIAFLLVVFTSIVLYALTIALTQEVNSLRLIGLRYTAAAIPLLAMSAGLLIVRISRGRIAIWLSLVLVFALTRFDQLAPWISWNPHGRFQVGKYSVVTHVPSTTLSKFVDFGLIRFLCNLWRSNPGTMGRTAEFLRRHASPGDVVITNFESEPLYFYTRLPQGLRIANESSIYQAARREGLPDYVFGLARARWIIWRFSWDGYFGITWAQVEQSLRAKGAQVTEITKLKETGWENRENIHFSRFCGGKHLFREHHHFQRARIYRVDYPKSSEPQ